MGWDSESTEQGTDTAQVAPTQTLRCTIPRARGWLQPSSPGCGYDRGGFQLPRGWKGLVFCSKAGEDPHPEVSASLFPHICLPAMGSHGLLLLIFPRFLPSKSAVTHLCFQL